MTGLEKTVLALILVLWVVEFREGSFRLGLCGARLQRNLGFAAAAVAVGLVLRQVNALAAGWALFAWPHPVVEMAACVLVAELFGWTVHYVKHVHPFLWKFHFQHHREEEFNLWLTTHTHALEVMVSGCVMAAVLAGCGFSAGVVEIYLLFYTLAKFFHHSSHDYSLGFLDRVIITPAYHRWHHEVEGNCNFGVTLTVFDVLFGTVRWPSGERPLRYGVRDARLPFGFVAEHLWFLRFKKEA